eukprot:9499345-Pyramimonas_sp.AAC.1
MKHWALAAISALPGRGPLEACWSAGLSLLARPRPWAQCVDPAQAALLSFARVGISMPSAFSFVAQDVEYSVLQFSPGFCCDRVRQMALDASDVMSLRRLEGAWQAPLHWAPVRRLLDKR